MAARSALSGRKGAQKPRWLAFPHPNDAFRYPRAALREHWERLHLGDREPFPSVDYLRRLSKGDTGLAAKLAESGADVAKLAQDLAQAWRLYHAGEFQQAAEHGVSLGVLGYAVANKATAIYANYIEESDARRLRLLNEVVTRAQEARGLMPEHANSHYLYAYALGRYSQGISVLQALAQGLGGKVKDALERTLALEAKHADAHIALGTYHAEVVDKVGSLIGGLTYGASKEAAVKHYQKALSLNPSSAIARIEYARALLMLFGESKAKQAQKLYTEACGLDPADAMERLDVELALAKREAA